jgi:hypothetical protein
MPLDDSFFERPGVVSIQCRLGGPFPFICFNAPLPSRQLNRRIIPLLPRKVLRAMKLSTSWNMFSSIAECATCLPICTYVSSSVYHFASSRLELLLNLTMCLKYSRGINCLTMLRSRLCLCIVWPTGELMWQKRTKMAVPLW